MDGKLVMAYEVSGGLRMRSITPLCGQPEPHGCQVKPDHVADLEGRQAAPAQVEDVPFRAAEVLRQAARGDQISRRFATGVEWSVW